MADFFTPSEAHRSVDEVKPMRPLVKNTVNGGVVGYMVVAMFAMSIACCGVAQEAAGWAGAKVTKTDLLTGETNHSKFAYFFASVMTRAGCHVAKVEGERGKEMFVRRDGQCGKAYADIAHPVFSPDGSALGYAGRGVGGWRFVINDQEGPIFDEVKPDTFVFSNDGKRHAYLARKAGRLVAVVDGVLQAEAGGDVVPWHQPPQPPQLPVFSADGSSVAYLEDSQRRKQMRVVVNGKPGEFFDGVGLQSLRFSPDGRHFCTPPMIGARETFGSVFSTGNREAPSMNWEFRSHSVRMESDSPTAAREAGSAFSWWTGSLNCRWRELLTTH